MADSFAYFFWTVADTRAWVRSVSHLGGDILCSGSSPSSYVFNLIAGHSFVEDRD